MIRPCAVTTGLLIALVAVAMGVAAAQEPEPLEPPHYEEPEHNAFDDYIAAAAWLTDDLPERISEAFDAPRPREVPFDATVLLGDAEFALEALRQGVRRQCLMPGDLDFTSDLWYLSKFRALTRLLCVEGRHYEWEGEWDKAVGAYLDGLKLAQDMARRGCLIHRLVNIACETMVLHEMRECVSLGAPDAAALRKAAEGLAGLEGSEVPLTETLLWEWQYGRDSLRRSLQNVEALAGALGDADLPRLRPASVALTERSLEAFYRAQIAHYEQPYPIVAGAAEPEPPGDWLARMIAPSLRPAYDAVTRAWVAFAGTAALVAVRRYALDHGEYPKTLEELVPDYLKAVPVDLYDEQPLRYERMGDDYLLYSVGEDMVDDGGVPLEGPPGKQLGDVVFHMPK